jgi:aldose 1-epimerase
LLLELRAGGLELALLPEAGGAVVRLAASRVDLLRPADLAAARRDPTQAAGFPLVPYSGAVVGGRFCFAGREHELARNHPNEPEPTHGEGWVAAWEVVGRSEASATLRYRHEPTARTGSFPFPYVARQTLSLAERTLTVLLELRNDGDGPMPAGLGWHPYFPNRDGLTLTLDATAFWSRTPLAPGTAALRPLPEAWRFDRPRRAAGLAVDDLFEGWSGRALLHWPASSVRLALEAAPPLEKVQLFALADQDFLCVEPVSNANDGFNLLAAGIDGHGVRVLQPGERLAGEVRLKLL